MWRGAIRDPLCLFLLLSAPEMKEACMDKRICIFKGLLATIFMWTSTGGTGDVLHSFGSTSPILRSDEKLITWTEVTMAPTASGRSAIGWIDNYVYVFGGGADLNCAMAWDVTDENWVSSTPYPGGGDNWAGVVVNGELYVIGRYDGFEPTADFYKFTPDGTGTGKWTRLTNYPRDITMLAAAGSGNIIYTAGGYTGSGGTRSAYKYTISTNTWAPIASLPAANYTCGGAFTGGKFYVIGGLDTNYTYTNTVYEYEPSFDVWTTKSPMPLSVGFDWSSVITVPGFIYVVGGGGSYGAWPALNAVQVYDPVRNEWTLDTPLPYAYGTNGASCVGSGNYILSTGGYDGSGYVKTTYKGTGLSVPFYGAIKGQVADFETGTPIKGAIVIAHNSLTYSDTTDIDGYYSLFEVVPHTYDMSVAAHGYSQFDTSNITVTEGDTPCVNFGLTHPEFDIEPDSFVFWVPVNDSLDTLMTIFNTGNGRLSFNISVNYDEENEDEDTLYYDTGDTIGVGRTQTGKWEGAIRLTPDELVDYNRWQISSVLFYHYESGSQSGSIKIYDGFMPVPTIPGILLTQDNYTIYDSGWKRVDLSYPVVLDVTRDVWVSVEIIQLSVPLHPLGVDVGPMVSDKGGFFNLSGTWEQLADIGIDRNWCIRAIVKRVGWLTVEPMAGEVAAGRDTNLSITINTTGLVPDTTYKANISIANNSQTSPVEVPVVLHTSGAGVKEATSLPSAFNLYQNRPNPCAGMTIIKYAIPEKIEVSLRIYDITGRLVNTLVNEIQKPAYYSIKWDARDARKKTVPAGVYFMRIAAGNFVSVKKLVVVR